MRRNPWRESFSKEKDETAFFSEERDQERMRRNPRGESSSKSKF
jgi:hypothetical protein